MQPQAINPQGQPIQQPQYPVSPPQQPVAQASDYNFATLPPSNPYAQTIQTQAPVYANPAQFAQAPVAPVQAQPISNDPEIQKLKQTVDQLQQNVQQIAPQQQPTQSELQQLNPKSWQDVDAYIQKKSAEVLQQTQEQQQQQAQQEAQQKAQQEAQIHQQVDQEINQLRQYGKLPLVLDPYNPNDPGKKAERELYGAAIALGTDDLGQVAEIINQQHQAGLRFDPDQMRWSNVNEEAQQQPQQPVSPADELFGNVPAANNTGQPAFQQQAPSFPQQPPVGFQQPLGPVNPYAPPVNAYPPGFNAPVAAQSGAAIARNGKPTSGAVRNLNYSQLRTAFDSQN